MTWHRSNWSKHRPPMRISVASHTQVQSTLLRQESFYKIKLLQMSKHKYFKGNESGINFDWFTRRQKHLPIPNWGRRIGRWHCCRFIEFLAAKFECPPLQITVKKLLTSSRWFKVQRKHVLNLDASRGQSINWWRLVMTAIHHLVIWTISGSILCTWKVWKACRRCKIDRKHVNGKLIGKPMSSCRLLTSYFYPCAT